MNMNSERVKQCLENIKMLQKELERLQSDETVKRGDFFKYTNEFGKKEYFIVACIGWDEHCLVSLNTGNRWNDPMKSLKLSVLAGAEYVHKFRKVDLCFFGIIARWGSH